MSNEVVVEMETILFSFLIGLVSGLIAGFYTVGWPRKKGVHPPILSPGTYHLGDSDQRFLDKTVGDAPYRHFRVIRAFPYRTVSDFWDAYYNGELVEAESNEP